MDSKPLGLFFNVLIIVAFGALPTPTFSADQILNLADKSGVINVGNVLADEQAKTTVRIRNNLRTNVELESTESSCGCVAAKLSKKSIAANEVLAIDVRISSFQRSCVFEKTLLIRFRTIGSTAPSAKSDTFVVKLTGEASTRLVFPTAVCRADIGSVPWRFRAVKRDSSLWEGLRVACPGFDGDISTSQIDSSTIVIVFMPKSDSWTQSANGKAFRFSCHATINGIANVEVAESALVIPDTRSIRVIPEQSPGIIDGGASFVEFRIITSPGISDLTGQEPVRVIDEELRTPVIAKLVRLRDRIWRLELQYEGVVQGRRNLAIEVSTKDHTLTTTACAIFPTLPTKSR